MNVCKFYKRLKDGTLDVLRIRVTQTHIALNQYPHPPTVAQARRTAAGHGFTHKRRRSDRVIEDAA